MATIQCIAPRHFSRWTHGKTRTIQGISSETTPIVRPFGFFSFFFFPFFFYSGSPQCCATCVKLLNLHNKAESKRLKRIYESLYRYINRNFFKRMKKKKKFFSFHFNVQKIQDLIIMKNTRKKSSCAMFYFECCLVQRKLFLIRWNVLWNVVMLSDWKWRV